MKRIVILSAIASSLLASGYRLPENSINSTALSGAYTANAHGADSSYYNPANMVFNDNVNRFEADLTYIKLSSIKYKDAQKPQLNSKSKEENIIAPSAFFSSKDYNGFRYGLALAAPGGLGKRWSSPYAKASAKKFELKILEFNPTIAYKVSDIFSIGAGVRAVYSEGKVQSDASSLGKPVVRDMEADTTEYGYNLALSYKPVKPLSISATYRSKVDLNNEGNAKLYLSGTKLYDGGASVSVPLPAIVTLATAFDFGGTIVEAQWDKTKWSDYNELDFEFKDNVPMALKAAFDDPKPRNWEDTNAFRLGITHHMDEKLTLMAGFAYDENPASSKYMGFELPDSDAKIYSGGLRYKYSCNLEFGASILYDIKDKRKVSQGRSASNPLAIEGEFSDGSALLITTGFNYNY